VHGGHRTGFHGNGSALRLELRRSRIGFRVDEKHDFDFAFWRHHETVEAALRSFAPDVVHLTGPSDVGQLAALVAHRLRVPLAASWHTNLHEYAEQRGTALFPFLSRRLKSRLGSALRRGSLRAIFRFYKIARILFAPNPELMELVENGTGKHCYPMPRGVDTLLFDPRRRNRSSAHGKDTDKEFVIGYVGRLTVEKNIRFLAELEQALIQAGMNDFKFVIVGQGSEEPWLKANMQRAEFAGVLQGEPLARAYANMDVFVFPSHTDTYGNVVLEAMASGVPAVVTNSGGPRFIVRPGETGFVAESLSEFVGCIQNLAAQPDELQRMRTAARTYALSASWDHVFEGVYASYEGGLKSLAPLGNAVGRRPTATIAGQLG
jgi:glycosyltransferase involved in cell wall biosynthesis